MTIDSVLTIIKNIIDICLVWAGLYFVLKSIKNNVKFTMLFKGIIVIVVIKVISDLFDLTAIGLLLEYVMMWGPLALVIVFQPEIRSVLEHLGRSQLLGRHKILTITERERIVSVILNRIWQADIQQRILLQQS